MYGFFMFYLCIRKKMRWDVLVSENFDILLFHVSLLWLKFESLENSSSVSQNFTLDKIDKVKHYITIKTHNTIVLTF